MGEIINIWKNILERIKKDITPSAYNAWLKDAQVDSYQDGVVYINVKNPFAKDWIQNKYVTKILNFFREVDSDVKNIEYIISPTTPKIDKNKAQTILKEDKTQKNELPLKDHYIDPNDNLNHKDIFETFVVGSFNELAFASAQAVIKKPAVYNPLFFHGSTGVGKTHLMQAVGNYYKNTLHKKVYYVTSERFTNDYISSLQNNKASQFKEKYRKYDLLIMDDIQFLSNKEKTQEELLRELL